MANDKQMMQVIRVHNYGGPEKLVEELLPIPEPESNQLLVKIHAAAINPYDWKLREGYFKDTNPISLPYVPGVEAAGKVIAVGSGIKKFLTGQNVYGNVSGSYAEYSLASEDLLFHKPSHLTFEEAASVPVGTQTSWSCLFDIANLQSGQTVLIHGGAGSVGSFAIQLAKYKRAYVISTTSSENVEFVKSLGADEVIDYKMTPFESACGLVDVVLDTVGGEIQNRSYRVLKKDGVLVSIVSAPLWDIAAKYGVKAFFRNRGISKEGLKNIQQLLNNGLIKPVIRKIYSLHEVGAAQELSKNGHGRGKIILKII